MMSAAPFLFSGKNRTGNKLGNLEAVDSLIGDGLTDVFNNYHMGITAENIADKHGITREEQDAFSYESQKRAIAAVDSGRFSDEIVPILIKNRKEEFWFDADEHMKTNLEKLAGLRPAFKKDGSVTAGNASGINDGASMTLLASKEVVDQYWLNPLVEIIAVGQGGVDPSVMGLGPVPAISNVLKNANMSLSDMGLIELNEVFGRDERAF